MATQACAIWGDDLLGYDFGEGHPMGPLRLDLTARLCREMGVFDRVEVLEPTVADDDLLATVHDRDFIAAVRAVSADPALGDGSHGLGTEDVPAFAGMHEASARLVAGTVEVVRRVWEGEAEHGVNFTGGMHHAMPDRAAGFCVYNDIAVGIQWLLDNGAQRVAYIDIDVHHGDGVQAAFYDDPRVMTMSVHESGRTLFPGTGWPGDAGGPQAEATAVNVPLPPGTGDSHWLRAITATFPPLLRAFKPDVIITQHGCDTHREDPLAHLAITVDAQRHAAIALHRLVHEICDGKWIAVGGGGYDLVGVVPRAWTHLTAIAAHQPIPNAAPIPPAWREHVLRSFDREAPESMGDLPASELPIWVQPWSLGYNPHNEVDRAIMATREATYPSWGLDVWFD